MEVPSFLKLEGEALVFNEDNKEFIFYLPEVFFNSTSKNAIAEIKGEYVSSIGLCNWAIVDSNGKRSELKPFRFPTMFLCKPYEIEKVKGVKLDYDKEPTDYRLLHFRKGDEVVSQIRVPQIIDNVELFFKLAIITAKIPTSIPYDEIWKIFLENMELNGNKYGINAQLFGIVQSEICRDPKDISRPFRYTDMKDMHAYKPISIKMTPKFISPYTSIVSEGWDEGLVSAVLMKDKEDIPESPLEKIVTM